MKNFFLYFKKFISISRYNKPHGIFLLFYPCIWGLSLSNKNILEVYHLCIIFFLGSCGMRAVGCIWNDLNDKKYDILVNRTKKRLVASGKVSKKEILFFFTTNLILGTLPLFFIGKFSVLLSFLVLPLIVSYPFMKRITWWPQFWLGLNFNWGLLVSYYSVSEISFSIALIFFYIGSVFWTIAYDTIYGFQDIKDDMRIGLKSTSIKFREKPKIFLIINFLICFLCWYASISTLIKDPIVIITLSIIFFPIIINTLILNISSPISCGKSFRNNSYFGFCITILLIYFNIYIL
jgi:4-hydroxybenzoate polyprenyl transferase